jgi:hypothetical protein
LVADSGQRAARSGRAVSFPRVAPRDSSPAPTLFPGQDGNLYGILEYTDINHEGETNGVVYQLSTTGEFNVPYRFPWTPDGPPVPTGSEPSHNLAMGRDGFLYGITKFGGAYISVKICRLALVSRKKEATVELPTGGRVVEELQVGKYRER